MIRTIAIAAGLVALATSAQAAELKLNLAGKDAASAHAAIVHAAHKVCGVAYRGDSLSPYLVPACVQETVESTVSQVGDAGLIAYTQAHPQAARSLKLAAR